MQSSRLSSLFLLCFLVKLLLSVQSLVLLAFACWVSFSPFLAAFFHVFSDGGGGMWCRCDVMLLLFSHSHNPIHKTLPRIRIRRRLFLMRHFQRTYIALKYEMTVFYVWWWCDGGGVACCCARVGMLCDIILYSMIRI